MSDMKTELTITKFLDDVRCIGRSDDGTRFYYQNTALLSDGSRVVMYNTVYAIGIDGFTSTGMWSEKKPYIARPNLAPSASTEDTR